MDAIRRQIEQIFRQESGQVLAALIAAMEDFDLAEDALQDAVVVALEKWPADGIPPRPGAWLMTAARRKAIDRLRRAGVYAQKTEELQALQRMEQDGRPDMPDE